MEFLPNDLQKYVENHTEPEPDLLNQINRETHLQVLKPRMLSGHLQGRILSMLSHMIGPKRILEIGTYTGYATLCMAEGLAKDGKIYTIEVNEELSERTKKYFDQSEYSDVIEMLIGNATEILPQLQEPWDMVFIDADKANYPLYYDMVIDHTSINGYIIADNVLWSGKVSDQSINDMDTIGMRAFNEKIHKDDRVQNVLFPIRDGLMIVRKK